MSVFENLYTHAMNSRVVNSLLKPQTHQTVVDGKVVNQIVVFNTPNHQHVIINTGGALSAMVCNIGGCTTIALDRITETELQTILLDAADEFTPTDAGTDYYELRYLCNPWAAI